MKFIQRSIFTLPWVVVYLALLWIAARTVDPALLGNGVGLFAGTKQDVCTPWTRVNEGGFGLDSRMTTSPAGPIYQGEDSFEVLVFKDQLYLGMEADNALGARLWRTKTGVVVPARQTDWEEVIADESGRPWGIENRPDVDHIDSLAEFNGYIYASSANSGKPTGTRIYRSGTGDPGSWEDVLTGLGPGFGDPDNENFKDMQVFDGYLCGGTWNETAGAEVWCTADGTTWEQKNESGFGDRNNRVIWSGGVFDGHLYFGVQNVLLTDSGSPSSIARIYRTGSLDGEARWELVYEGGPGSIWATIVGVLEDQLYISTPGRDGIRIFRSGTGDPESWVPANRPGMANTRLNTSTVPDGAAIYNGTLFISVQNPVRGFRVWELTKEDFWQVVGRTSEYDPAQLAGELVNFNGSLYAWVTDYKNGQTVLRTTCESASIETRPSVFLSASVVIALFMLFLAFARLQKSKKS